MLSGAWQGRPLVGRWVDKGRDLFPPLAGAAGRLNLTGVRTWGWVSGEQMTKES